MKRVFLISLLLIIALSFFGIENVYSKTKCKKVEVGYKKYEWECYEVPDPEPPPPEVPPPVIVLPTATPIPTLTPIPTATPVPAATSVPCPKKVQGDANCNGVINLMDYFYYVAAVNGGKIPLTVNPDFNGDGKVNASDRVIIIKSLKGK